MTFQGLKESPGVVGGDPPPNPPKPPQRSDGRPEKRLSVELVRWASQVSALEARTGGRPLRLGHAETGRGETGRGWVGGRHTPPKNGFFLVFLVHHALSVNDG